MAIDINDCKVYYGIINNRYSCIIHSTAQLVNDNLRKRTVQEMEKAIPTFLTIRQTAATGILREHHLRLMEKQGRLPGIRSGNRFLVNVPLLVEQLNRESSERARTGGGTQA